jgi:hypothetical protein
METINDQSISATPPSYREIPRKIKQLGHWRLARRWGAVESLRKVGPDAIWPLFCAAQSERREQAAKAILSGLLAGLATCLFDISFHPGNGVSAIIALMFVTTTVSVPLTWAKRKRECVVSVLKGLTGLDNPNAIAPLIQALEFPGPGYKASRIVVQDALANLLPLLTSSDASQLTDNQWTCLYRELLGGHVGLKFAILKVLVWTGDVNALPFVKNSLSLDPEVMAARTACLAVLQPKADQQRISRTLLRFSSPTSAESELVRAVATLSPTESEQLLRAPDEGHID